MPYNEDKEAYSSLCDEMNDPDVGPWNESDWDTEAVAGGKRYAEAHGFHWPPRTGDYDHFYIWQNELRAIARDVNMGHCSDDRCAYLLQNIDATEDDLEDVMYEMSEEADKH